MDEADKQWVCAYCGTMYVVATLARVCERKHEGTEGKK